MLEGILGLLGLGVCIFAKLAENDFDLDKIADEQLAEQDRRIEEQFKEWDRITRDK